MNSRAKGCRGEREFRDVLREAGFCKARRGQQFCGSPDSPDVICPELPGIHFEVKRCERGNPYDWVAQACNESIVQRINDAHNPDGEFVARGHFNENLIPVVAHKRNRCQWLAILPMEDFLTILRRSDLVQWIDQDKQDLVDKFARDHHLR